MKNKLVALALAGVLPSLPLKNSPAGESFSYPATESKIAYADNVKYFKPGKTVTGWENKVNNVLRGPKLDLDRALSLGHYGEVVVSRRLGMETPVCFERAEGDVEWIDERERKPSIMVHEPASSNNMEETVEVFVTSEKILNEKTHWESLGIKSVTGHKDNWIPFFLPEKFEKGFYVKLRDAGSEKISGIYAGFEASSVRFENPCRHIS